MLTPTPTLPYRPAVNTPRTDDREVVARLGDRVRTLEGQIAGLTELATALRDQAGRNADFISVLLTERHLMAGRVKALEGQASRLAAEGVATDEAVLATAYAVQGRQADHETRLTALEHETARLATAAGPWDAGECEGR